MIGYALQRWVINRVVHAPVLTTFVLTFGIETLIANLALRLFTADVRQTRPSYANTSLSVGEIELPITQLASLAVLAVVMYQLLSTDITRRLREYATLKALGYTDRALAWMVLGQGFALIGTALVVSLVLATIVCALIVATVHLPVAMTPGRGLGVSGLAVVLGIGITLLALRRLRAADPAALF